MSAGIGLRFSTPPTRLTLGLTAWLTKRKSADGGMCGFLRRRAPDFWPTPPRNLPVHLTPISPFTLLRSCCDWPRARVLVSKLAFMGCLPKAALREKRA